MKNKKTNKRERRTFGEAGEMFFVFGFGTSQIGLGARGGIGSWIGRKF